MIGDDEGHKADIGARWLLSFMNGVEARRELGRIGDIVISVPGSRDAPRDGTDRKYFVFDVLGLNRADIA